MIYSEEQTGFVMKEDICFNCIFYKLCYLKNPLIKICEDYKRNPKYKKNIQEAMKDINEI